jgi:hypothetical protein
MWFADVAGKGMERGGELQAAKRLKSQQKEDV